MLTVNIAHATLTLDAPAGAKPAWLDELLKAPALSKAPAQLPVIGKPWPGQGGVYAGLVRGEDGEPDHHLIVATDPAGHRDAIAWGGEGVEVAGCSHERDGLANTVALINADSSHPAAEWAAELDIDGHEDWYLPARRELRLCWVNVPELFPAGWYWSSTQCSRDGAWGQAFGVGNQDGNVKAYEGRARAVRRLPAQ